MIIEPGGFRTPFPAHGTRTDGGITGDYKEKMEAWLSNIDAVAENPALVGGDPPKFGARVLDAFDGTGLFAKTWAEHDANNVLRVQMGSDGYGLFGEKLKELNEGYAK
ncbi:uncharacterized protein BJX67DRAFT_383808 [Aspergillus lucknowensis]|uniref:Uncharacterized protein n=1 Tax=Aspergillus lucknowensis TaxID=176173 RepID=A0ABR4LIF8_9EURO